MSGYVVEKETLAAVDATANYFAPLPRDTSVVDTKWHTVYAKTNISNKNSNLVFELASTTGNEQYKLQEALIFIELSIETEAGGVPSNQAKVFPQNNIVGGKALYLDNVF